MNEGFCGKWRRVYLVYLFGNMFYYKIEGEYRERINKRKEEASSHFQLIDLKQ